MTDNPTLFPVPEPSKREYDFAAANEARKREEEERKHRPAPTAKETKTALVLAELSIHSGSDRAIAERLESKGFRKVAESVRKRRLELEQAGYVRFSGTFSDDGRRIYEITHAGHLRAGTRAAA